MVPQVPAEPYHAAHEHAAIVDRSRRGRIVVSGADRATYLNGLLTNDIAALKPGQGCYAAYLTAQGRMISDLFVYEVGDLMLLSLPGSMTATVLARLDQFVFSEDVKLGDVSDAFAQLAIVGSRAAGTLSSVLIGTDAGVLDALPEHGNLRATFVDQPVIVTRVTDLGTPGFDAYLDRRVAGDFRDALRRAGAATLDDATADAIRIESGIPAFGSDMDEETIPLEAGIESRAISLTKGCYVGQEVIIRVLHRGHGRVVRRLVGLTLAGDTPPAAGTVVTDADDAEKAIGRVTSSAVSPALDRPIALAYVHRDYVDPGTRVRVGAHDAVVTALPFV